jgi:hypothetical protein
MPKLIYEPEDGDRQEWDFDPVRLMSFDAEAIEEVGGTQWATYGEFIDKLQRGSAKAWRAALWIQLRRADPTLKFVNLVVKVNELIFIDDDDEDGEPGKDEPDVTPTDSESPPPDSEASENNSVGM